MQPAGDRHGVQRLTTISLGAPGLNLDGSTHAAGKESPKRTDRHSIFRVGDSLLRDNAFALFGISINTARILRSGESIHESA